MMHLLLSLNFTHYLVLICLVTSAIGTYLKYDCGPDKSCQCDRTPNWCSMMCGRRKLKSFHVDPVQDWSWVKDLNLKKNFLEAIPNLTAFPSLTSLTLSHNRIPKLCENSFVGLENLEFLDLSYMHVPLNLCHETFRRLTKLKDLRMKQSTTIESGDQDYSFLLPIRTTIETLLIVGTPNRSLIFNEDFPRLQYLSLGGSKCNLSCLPCGGFTNLRNSPLKTLSMRMCNIKPEERFFRGLANSLEKLDISCNPLRDDLQTITHSLMEGNLKVLIADSVNYKTPPCTWNITSEIILPSLQLLSLRYNHINYVVLKDNNTDTMKNLKYFDIGDNPFHGAGFDIFTTKCNHLFSCSSDVLHQLQFIGLDGITKAVIPCGNGPNKCEKEDFRISGSPFPRQNITHIDYLDAMIVKNFFKELERSAQDDVQTLRDNHFNISSLSQNSIVRILLEFIKKRPNSKATINEIIKLTVRADSKIQALLSLAEYLCSNQSVKEIYKETMRSWITLNSAKYTTWSDYAIGKTIDHICNQSDWHYGVRFITDDTFHWFLTNLTTVHAFGNAQLDQWKKPNKFCNNAVYFPNNLRNVDFTFSNITYIACSNISGLNTIGTLRCRQCNNRGWNFTAADFPALYHLYWPENRIGHLIRVGELLKGFSKLEVIDLHGQKDGIKYFQQTATFSDQALLKTLLLHWNGIEVWNISLQAHNYIEKLDLSNNKITYIDLKYRTDLERVYKNRGSKFSVYLAGNPIICSCNTDHLEFVKWLITAEVVADRDRLVCGNGKPLRSLFETCFKAKAVLSTTAIIFICTSVSVAFLGFVAFGLVIRRRFNWRRASGYEQLSNETLPTAFISFPQQMTDQVKALKDTVEGRLTIIASVWDFVTGDTLSNSLSGILGVTRKFILVITPDYFNDEETSKEFHLMQNAGLLKRGKLLLIFTSANTSGNQLPGVLQDMYSDGEFLIWPSCDCAGNQFHEMAAKVVEKVSD